MRAKTKFSLTRTFSVIKPMELSFSILSIYTLKHLTAEYD